MTLIVLITFTHSALRHTNEVSKVPKKSLTPEPLYYTAEIPEPPPVATIPSRVAMEENVAYKHINDEHVTVNPAYNIFEVQCSMEENAAYEHGNVNPTCIS